MSIIHFNELFQYVVFVIMDHVFTVIKILKIYNLLGNNGFYFKMKIPLIEKKT